MHLPDSAQLLLLAGLQALPSLGASAQRILVQSGQTICTWGKMQHLAIHSLGVGSSWEEHAEQQSLAL